MKIAEKKMPNHEAKFNLVERVALLHSLIAMLSMHTISIQLYHLSADASHRKQTSFFEKRQPTKGERQCLVRVEGISCVDAECLCVCVCVSIFETILFNDIVTFIVAVAAVLIKSNANRKHHENTRTKRLIKYQNEILNEQKRKQKKQIYNRNLR